MINQYEFIKDFYVFILFPIGTINGLFPLFDATEMKLEFNCSSLAFIGFIVWDGVMIGQAIYPVSNADKKI